jgi:hypothetical protein
MLDLSSITAYTAVTRSALSCITLYTTREVHRAAKLIEGGFRVRLEQLVQGKIQRVSNEEQNLVVLECCSIELEFGLFVLSRWLIAWSAGRTLLDLDYWARNHGSAWIADMP